MNKIKMLADNSIDINNNIEIISIGDKHYLYNNSTNEIGKACEVYCANDNMIAMGDSEYTYIFDKDGKLKLKFNRTYEPSIEVAKQIASMIDIEYLTHYKIMSRHELGWRTYIENLLHGLSVLEICIDGIISIIFDKYNYKIIDARVGSIKGIEDSKDYLYMSVIPHVNSNNRVRYTEIISKDTGEVIMKADKFNSVSMLNEENNLWKIDGAVGVISNNKFNELFSEAELIPYRFVKRLEEVIVMYQVADYVNYYNKRDVTGYGRCMVIDNAGNLLYKDVDVRHIFMLCTIVSGVNSDGNRFVTIYLTDIRCELKDKAITIYNVDKAAVTEDGKILVWHNDFECVQIDHKGNYVELGSWAIKKLENIKMCELVKAK